MKNPKLALRWKFRQQLKLSCWLGHEAVRLKCLADQKPVLSPAGTASAGRAKAICHSRWAVSHNERRTGKGYEQPDGERPKRLQYGRHRRKEQKRNSL